MCISQIILSLLKEKVAKQPLGAEDLAAAAIVAVGAEVVPKVLIGLIIALMQCEAKL